MRPRLLGGERSGQAELRHFRSLKLRPACRLPSTPSQFSRSIPVYTLRDMLRRSCREQLKAVQRTPLRSGVCANARTARFSTTPTASVLLKNRDAR